MVPLLHAVGAAIALAVLAFIAGAVVGGGGGGDDAAVQATPTVRSTTTTRVTRHTVASGESLLGIASRYGVTAEALAAANGITNQNHVFVGQVLTIPPSTTATTGATSTSSTTTAP
jgi:LysM repeat protein